MKPALKNTLKIALPVALGVFLIVYSYRMTTADDRREILRYIRQADLFWVGISIGIGMLSHISRAIRWNYLWSGPRSRIFSGPWVTGPPFAITS